MAVLSNVTVNWNVNPRIINIPDSLTSVSVQNLHDTLRSIEHNLPEGMSQASLIDSAGKENLGGGVSVGITSTLQNAQILFEARTGSDSTGACTTANAAGTVLIDSAANFVSAGIVRGDSIFNTTDGSVATVISVDTGTQITHYPLADGTDNDWDEGDAYKIWNKVQCEISGGNLVAVDENGDSMSAFIPSAFTHVIRTSSSSATLTSTNTVGEIADAVWDEATSGHVTSGSTGAEIQKHKNVLVDTTISGITSQTIFTLTAGSSVDNAYNDQAIVLYDTSNNNFPSVRKITDYTGSSKTVTIDSAPDFTIATTDGVKVFVTAPGTTAPTAPQVADAVWNEETSGHTTAGTYGKVTADTRTSQQKAYTANMSADYKVEAGSTYRCKLFVLNYETTLVNANSTPTVTIYDVNRNTIVNNANMTPLATGIYEYTNTISGGASTGTWEIVVTIDLDGVTTIKANDYFEVTISPA